MDLVEVVESATAAPGELRRLSRGEAGLDRAKANQLALAELIRRHRGEYEQLVAEARASV